MENPDDGFEFKVPGWVIRQNYPNATTLGTKCELPTKRTGVAAKCLGLMYRWYWHVDIDAVYMVFLRPEIAFTG